MSDTLVPRTIAALVRHGEYRQRADTPSAHQPWPLTGRGAGAVQLAAKEFAALLQQQNLSPAARIDSSHLLRAWQTAEIFASNLFDSDHPDGRIDCFDALAERGLGSAANLTVDEIEQVLAEDPRCDAPPAGWKADSRYCLPLQGAESLLQAGARVAQHLQLRMQELREHVREDTVKLFVGHGAAFRHAAHHLGVLEFAELALLSMHHARPVLIEYREDGSWRHVGGEWKRRDAGNGLD